MAASVADIRARFYATLWYGAAAIAVLFLSFLLASDQIMIAMFVAGVGWLILLPYHARLAFTLSMATFTSALIVPFMPGRPFLWEVAAVLVVSGVPITLFLRRFAPDFGEAIRRNRTLLIGAAFYCVVLVQIMIVRGIGFRIFGGSQVGGRYYFQQILCAGFPVLFALLPLSIKQFNRLFVIQCLLTATYVLSDIALSGAGGKLIWLLNALELPNDALSFERRSMLFGVRRFQSAGFFAQAMVYLVCVFVPLRAFFTGRAVWLVPTLLVVFAGGLYGGHRMFLVSTIVPLLVIAFIQRLYTLRNLLIITFIMIPLFSFTYAYSNRFPQAFQRSISFLPGIDVDAQAAKDAASTAWVRKTLIGVGIRLVPDYFWVGRGFARYLDEYSPQFDPTTINFHVNQGKFYNGIIGLLVNTGIFGTVAMLLFIAGGTSLAWRISRRIRRQNLDGPFPRICGLLAGQWVVGTLSFIFLHGDAEWAMKSFSLLVGMMIAAERLMLAPVPAAEIPDPAPDPAPNPGVRRLSPVMS
jgi:hypothetical protein